MEPWTPENEDLIREVQKRSALYDHSVTLSALGREKLWLDVCQSLCQDEFHDISDDQKEIRVREIRKKWRNLRDCFTKDINQRSRRYRYQGKRKRRRYLYFDDLLFLAPFVTAGEKTTPTTNSGSNSAADTSVQNQTNNSEEDASNDNSCDVADEDSEQVYEMVSFSETDNSDSTTRRPTSTTAAAGGGGVDPTAFLQVTNGVEEDIDEDKAFLLSLVPAFRRLSQSQRLAAKIEMLKVVQRISFPET